MWKKIKPYVISIIIALGVGGLSALITKDNMNIYDTIIKPPLTPPSWLFPVVWSILFVLMGISSAIIFEKSKGNLKGEKPLIIYGVQLLVNFIWNIIFFNLNAFLFSFVWLIFLWVLIILMIYLFCKVDKTAALLQVPYLLWVSFAGYLNLMIYILNA